MNLAPLAAAPAIMLVHAAAASLSLVAGTAVLFMAKGTARHLLLGRCFVLAMLVTALTSFAITSVNHGHFSPIHILSVVTLVSVPLAVRARRLGNISRHAQIMVLNYIGLLVAGGFTLLPPRLLSQLFQ